MNILSEDPSERSGQFLSLIVIDLNFEPEEKHFGVQVDNCTCLWTRRRRQSDAASSTILEKEYEKHVLIFQKPSKIFRFDLSATSVNSDEFGKIHFLRPFTSVSGVR